VKDIPSIGHNQPPPETVDLLSLYNSSKHETTAWAHDLSFGSAGVVTTLAVAGFGTVIPILGALVVAGFVVTGQMMGEAGYKAAEAMHQQVMSVIEQYPEAFTKQDIERLAIIISQTYVTPYYPLKIKAYPSRMTEFKQAVEAYLNDKKLSHHKRLHIPMPEPFLLKVVERVPHHGKSLRPWLQVGALGNFLTRKTRIGSGCHLCSRYVVLPMCPGRTGEAWWAR